jgi:LGFP repeat
MRRMTLILPALIFLACVLCLPPRERASAQGPSKSNPIEVKYGEEKGSGGILGAPLGAEQKGAGGGRFRLYQNGAIYWSPQTGAHELHGVAFQKYKEMGAEAGALGYPVSDVTETADGGREVIFRHGFITLSKTDAARSWAMPWATFTEDSVSVGPGGRVTQKSASTAALLPLPETGPPGEATVSCGCNSQRLGNCTLVIKRGTTVQCLKGSCSDSCVIKVISGS